MREFYVVLVCLGFIVVALSLVENKINRLPATDPLVALVFGVFIGPKALGWVDPTAGVTNTRFFITPAR